MPLHVIYNDVNTLEPSILSIDCVSKHSPKISYGVTDHPIESGSSINDHVTKSPKEISIDITVPKIRTKKNYKFEQGKLIPIPQIPIASGIEFELPTETNIEIYDKIKKIADSFTICTILVDEDIYENVIITDISRPIDTSTGDIYLISLSFKEINIAKLKRVKITSYTQAKITSYTQAKITGKKLSKTQNKNKNNASIQEDKGPVVSISEINALPSTIQIDFGVTPGDILSGKGSVPVTKIKEKIKKYSPGSKTYEAYNAAIQQVDAFSQFKKKHLVKNLGGQ